jgi:hypothetical protein
VLRSLDRILATPWWWEGGNRQAPDHKQVWKTSQVSTVLYQSACARERMIDMTRRASSPWARGAVRGMIDNRLPLFQLRIERVEESGVVKTEIWAHESTHRVFAWAELDVQRYRYHPVGETFLSERLVRDAVERARGRDAECLALLLRFMNPDPPGPGLRLVS